MWTITAGLSFCRDIEVVLARAGFHCALGGGVMLRDTSAKDLDVFIYPHRSDGIDEPDWNKARAALLEAGIEDMRKLDHHYDHKNVWKGYLNRKRIDFFFLS
jgi:hypothetical protein